MDEFALNYLEGTVDSVVYQNEENGYTVLRLDVGEEELVTVVGCMPGVAPGESLTAQGSWTRHATYGQQFKAEVARRGMPVGEKAIFDYLASGVVRGVGISTARRMVEEFGEDALDVLENHPEKLTVIKGITKKRAEAMGEAFWIFSLPTTCRLSWVCPFTAASETGRGRRWKTTPTCLPRGSWRWTLARPTVWP